MLHDIAKRTKYHADTEYYAGTKYHAGTEYHAACHRKTHKYHVGKNTMLHAIPNGTQTLTDLMTYSLTHKTPSDVKLHTKTYIHK